MVAFSGGKALGGPTASGILCGRKDLIAAALLQQLDLDYVSDDWQPPARLIDRTALPGVPRHGIGRACKAGKEQIVGLITALDRFLAEGDEARNARFAHVIEAVHAALSAPAAAATTAHGRCRPTAISPSWTCASHRPPRTTAAGSTAQTSRTAVPAVPLSTKQLAARLREAHPAVHVDSTRADRGVLTLVPTCLTPRGRDADCRRLPRGARPLSPRGAGAPPMLRGAPALLRGGPPLKSPAGPGRPARTTREAKSLKASAISSMAGHGTGEAGKEFDHARFDLGDAVTQHAAPEQLGADGGRRCPAGASPSAAIPPSTQPGEYTLGNRSHSDSNCRVSAACNNATFVEAARGAARSPPPWPRRAGRWDFPPCCS